MFLVTGQDGSFLSNLSDIIFFCTLFCVFIFDWKDRRIPNYCICLIWLASVYRLFSAPADTIFSACVASLPFCMLHCLKPKALGWADVKLTAAIGAYTGYQTTFWAMVIGVLLSVCYCLGCAAVRLQKRGQTERITVPLGGFICMGAFVVRIMK